MSRYNQEFIDGQREIVRTIWGMVVLAIVLPFVLFAFGIAMYFFFGEFAVKVYLLAIGLIVIFLLVHWMYRSTAHTLGHVHRATVDGIIRHQAADDWGEINRVNAGLTAHLLKTLTADNSAAAKLAIEMNRQADRMATQRAQNLMPQMPVFDGDEDWTFEEVE